MKITFVPIEHISNNLQLDSTLHRAKKLIDYMPDTYINSSDDFINTCDVIIYQDRCEVHDRLMAKRLKAKGKKIILDLSFPLWNPYYPYSSSKVSNFYSMIEFCSVVVVPNEIYKYNLLEQFKHKKASPTVEIIETGYDYDTYKNSAYKYMELISVLVSGKFNIIDKPVTESSKVVSAIKDIKILRFNHASKYHVHIRDLRDGWIMQIIGDNLQKLEDPDILFTFSKQQDPLADINYYINWTSNQPRLDKMGKTKCDTILFTHKETKKANILQEIPVLRWADKLTCMSPHGKQDLIDFGVPEENISVIDSFGVSIDYYSKVTLGWAGRPYINLGRKNHKEYIKLAKDLDKDIFKFIIYTTRSDTEEFINLLKATGMEVEVNNDNYLKFIHDIDYYLSLSTIEGGPMDILNMFKAGIPVVSRNIGFFHKLKTEDDILINNYDDLLDFFKYIEKNKRDKKEEIKSYTWANFRKWHVKYFRKELGLD